MATPAVTPQATAWDEQGNPVQPKQPSAIGATAWDEQGNPVQQGAGEQTQDKGFLSTVGSDVKEAGAGLLDFAKGLIEHPMWPGSYDPENPIVKTLASQFDSSMQAKGRMMESAKKGDALGAVQHAAGMVPIANQVDAAMTKYQENPSHENLAHVVTAAIPAFVPSMIRGVGKAAGSLEGATEAGEATEATKPGIVKQVIKGKAVEQEPAQAALREAAGSGESSLRESLAKPIADSEAKADALYKQIDSSGVDVKAMNRKLQNTNRQLRQLTDTPEDQAMEAKLELSRTGLMDKIKESGVDPKLIKQADAQFRQTRALADVEAKIFKNPDIVEGNSRFGTEETVNVDKAIKALEKLESSKYGARVEQAFGKEGANELKSKLYAAQRQGVHALKMQQVAKWVAGIVGAGAVAKGAGVLSGEK